MMLQQNAMRCCLFQNMHSIHALLRFVICYAVCRANSFRFLPLKALLLERFALFYFLVKTCAVRLRDGIAFAPYEWDLFLYVSGLRKEDEQCRTRESFVTSVLFSTR